MKIALIIIILYSFYFSGVAQTYIISDLSTLSDQYTVDKSGKSGLIDPSIEGSPYLNDKFLEGEVIINDSIRIENVHLRYNIYNDKIEFKNENEQILEIGNHSTSYIFNFEELLFRNLDYLNDGTPKQGILEILVDGQVKLYKKYSLKLETATKAVGFQEATPNRFVRKDDVYLIAVDQEIPYIFNNAKKLLPELQKIKPDINSFIKTEKIRLRSEKGLHALIQYCNK